MNTAANNKTAHRQAIYSILVLLLLLGGATGLGFLFTYAGIFETNIVIIYILSTLITARLTSGYMYGIAASLASTSIFNFLFTEPYYTFSVSDPGYIVTFVIMTITALVTSALTSKAKKSALEAEEKEAEAGMLNKLTNLLTDAQDIDSIAYTAVSTISDVMNCLVACLCFDDSGVPESTCLQQTKSGKPIRQNVEDAAEIKNRIDNLHTSYDICDEFYDFPIYGHETTLGIIRVPADCAKQFSYNQMKTLHSMIENIALAMDRFYIAQKQLRAREETERERYRGNLLRSISHDIRTPLAGILGSSQILMDVAGNKDEVIEIAKDIYHEADWLHSLVENILNLTRLQDGKLIPQKQGEAAEEIIGFAVSRISHRYPGTQIAVFAPDELIVIPMDARLISQVLINLLDNAVKYTEDMRGIAITLTKDQAVARFTVTDEGKGLDKEDLPNIFDMFYTAHRTRADAQYGIGLGLTICKAIVNAHGGEITASNRADRKGAEFSFTLPLEGVN